MDGIKSAIEERKKYPTNRTLLVEVLKQQYANLPLTNLQKENIEKLADDNTYTITTAHQPNIFTGHLYFIYKILHAIKLANYLSETLPENYFVPVYYMGSEDADIDELGEVTILGTNYKWQTKQTGAVGRMKVDDALLKILDAIAGAVTVLPNGNEIISLLKKHYTLNKTIEQATLGLVNDIFASYGLLILLPDNPVLKKQFTTVAKKELKEQFSHIIVEETKKKLAENYKIQAGGRELNLFYLKDNIRERIEFKNNKWSVVNYSLEFTEEELMNELATYPERFSPNVILRPVFQEMILPNVGFIGGGGELAYWLELKGLFEYLKVPYPIIVLRNSFLLIDKKSIDLASKLQLSTIDLFKKEFDLITNITKAKSLLQLDLKKEKESLCNLYQQIKKQAGNIDTTLAAHTQALHMQALHKIEALEKKMLKAEKKKFEAEQRQISKLKQTLFPNNSLQERVENIVPYYAKYGNIIFETLYTHSLQLEQQFTILTEK